MSSACSIRMLGGFEATVDGKAVSHGAWRHRRGADLVKLIALARGHQLHRERVIEALWPDLDPEAAGANLRKAIHFARRALGSRHAIEAESGLLRLWPGGDLSIDVDRFESAARRALADGREIEAAARLYGGELLPADRYAEWTEPRREQLRLLCLQLWRSAGRWEEVLQVDPADEDAHRALMREHLESGRRQLAIRQFYRLREVLRVDLGMAPDEETVALFESALVQRKPLLPTVAERAQALIARGLLAWSRGQYDVAEALAAEVRTLAIDHRLARELGEASALLGLTAFAQGAWQVRFRAEFEQAIRLQPKEAAQVFDAHVCLAVTTLGSAEPAAVSELARELLLAAERERSLHGRALASLLIGEAEFASGELDEATGWLDAAIELGALAASNSAQVLALVRLAEIEGYRGRDRAAQRAIARARPLAAVSPLAPHLIIRVHAARLAVVESNSAIEEALDAAEADLRPGDVCGPCSIGFRVKAVLACARAGELARARHCLALAEALAGMWQGGPWRAATWEARAVLRIAEGDRETAVGLLHEARDLFAQTGRRLDALRCERAVADLRVFSTS